MKMTFPLSLQFFFFLACSWSILFALENFLGILDF